MRSMQVMSNGVKQFLRGHYHQFLIPRLDGDDTDLCPVEILAQGDG